MGSMRPARDIDDYIANASDCTRPILVKLRQIFQQASPKLEEAIKWGVPCFVYKGPVGGFAAYRQHVSWGLWKARLLNDPDGLIGRGIAMGGRITQMSEMPPASKMVRLIKQVIALNEAGIKNPKPPDPDLPADFAVAMKKSDKAAKLGPPSRRLASGNTSSGSPKPGARKRAARGFRRPSTRSVKAKR
jgi:hypothetical protein